MKPLLVSLTFLISVSMATGVIATAQEATPEASPAATDLTLPADQLIDGMSLTDLYVRAWQWSSSFPAETSPLTDETGERCGFGQQGPVFFIAGSILPDSVTRTCLVPAGMPLLLPTVGANCSTIEPPPFFGADEAELRACLAGLFEGQEFNQSVTVDGVDIGDIESYRVQTPPFDLALPEGNIFGVPATVATVMAEGYNVLLAPLSAGEHTVVATATIPGLGELSMTLKLIVAEPEIIVPEASPVASPET